jgi:transposase-like protein
MKSEELRPSDFYFFQTKVFGTQDGFRLVHIASCISLLSIRHSNCPHCGSSDFVKRGSFYKRSTKTYIPRYNCHTCHKTFSTRTLSPTFNQKRTDLNDPIFRLLCAGVSLRETARVLKCSYKTVYLKFIWLGRRAKEFHLRQSFTINELQFDETYSIEHTKLKPLGIAIAVDDNYKIPNLPNIVKSDAKTEYKKVVQEIFPKAPYQVFSSSEFKEKKREQKYLSQEKRIFDPLFSINHVCARLRDHIKRLTRRSWCTTKVPEHLELNIYLYIAKNNKYSFL